MTKPVSPRWIFDDNDNCPVKLVQMMQIIDILSAENEDEDDETDTIIRKALADADICLAKTDKEIQLYVEFVMPDDLEYVLPFYAAALDGSTVWYKPGIYWDDMKKASDILMTKEDDIYTAYLQYKKLKPFA